MSTAQPEEPITRGELVISYLLRGGVVLSLVTILAGVGLMFAHHPEYWHTGEDLEHLTKIGATFPHTLSEVAKGLREGRGQAVVCVGLLLLIATPILRVVVSIVMFAAERDYGFVAITTVVLAILVLSFFLGKVE
jgi:uncharacterized membrane protein